MAGDGRVPQVLHQTGEPIWQGSGEALLLYRCDQRWESVRVELALLTHPMLSSNLVLATNCQWYLGLQLKIHHDFSANPLHPQELAEELRRMGFVVFVSGRVRQRVVANELRELVTDDMEVICGEAGPPNYCYCMVDVGRHEYGAILELAQQLDVESEGIQSLVVSVFHVTSHGIDESRRLIKHALIDESLPKDILQSWKPVLEIHRDWIAMAEPLHCKMLN